MAETKGQRLKRMRDECGLTQDEVAKYLNVSKQTIYKYTAVNVVE
jgi:DNA-binding XRE family transcriptional regulator